MVAASIGSLSSVPFMPDISNSVSENETVDERRHEDFEAQLSDDDSDIQIVDR